MPALLRLCTAQDWGNSSDVQLRVVCGLVQQCNIMVAQCCSSYTGTLSITHLHRGGVLKDNLKKKGVMLQSYSRHEHIILNITQKKRNEKADQIVLSNHGSRLNLIKLSMSSPGQETNFFVYWPQWLVDSKIYQPHVLFYQPNCILQYKRTVKEWLVT